MIAGKESNPAINRFSATRIGCDVSFTRHFYKPQPLRTLAEISAEKREEAFNYLISFLMSFASRAGTRERLQIFTTNYDRYIEAGANAAGLRLIDRFVGTLAPVFRASRLDVDLHYNPPGIRGEPRYLEGVERFTKLHGSVDWLVSEGSIRRIGLPFGAQDLAPFLSAPGLTGTDASSLMIYPNAARDRETTAYPYVELFRDFAASICRPNSTVVCYDYRVVKISMHLDKRRHVEADDFVISMRSFQGGLERTWSSGAIRSSYVVLKPTLQNHPSYFQFLFKSTPYISALRATADFIRDGQDLNFSNFCGVSLPLIPKQEQKAIGRFLDWANGRLERAIRAKRKVIALPGEQKEAIIHRAVTRGLDPSVPLKPSGIPWLGDIPQHWEVMPLKGVCTIQSGITLGKDYTGQALREYPCLRVANVQAGHVNLSVVKTIRVTKAEADRCMLQSGDVLMTEGGDLDKLGRGCVWNAQISPCLHQNHVFAVRPSQSRLEPRFLSALMGTGYARAYFHSTAKQTTNLAATNKTRLGMFKVVLPGVDEQQRILATLDEELRPVNAGISRLEREIELLREYRTRLVADVVTGKLDAREAAARLPDEAPLDAAEDDTELGDEAESVDEEAAV